MLYQCPAFVLAHGPRRSTHAARTRRRDGTAERMLLDAASCQTRTLTRSLDRRLGNARSHSPCSPMLDRSQPSIRGRPRRACSCWCGWVAPTLLGIALLRRLWGRSGHRSALSSDSASTVPPSSTSRALILGSGWTATANKAICELVRLAARLIIEEGLEPEATDALRRGYYARGAARKRTWLADS